MALKPGSVNDFSASMAEAIEQAFTTEWNAHKTTPLQAASAEDRKIMFAAIAQGVVRHLKEQAESSFVIDVSVSGSGFSGTGSGTITEVKTDE
jgi:hypothetical protein